MTWAIEGPPAESPEATLSTATAESILFVLPWDVDAVGGVSTVVASLMAEARDSMHLNPVVLVSSWKDKRIRESTVAGFDSAHFRLRSPFKPSAPLRAAILYCLSLPIVLARLTRYLRQRRVAVVNIHYPGPHLLPFAMLRQLRVHRGPLIVSLHGLDLVAARDSTGAARLSWGGIFRAADAIVTCSNSLAQQFVDAFPQLSERVVAVWNGVDVVAVEQGAVVEALPPDIRDVQYILSVGTFEEKKGHDVLLRAFARLAPARPELHMVIVGRSGPTLSLLLQLRDEYGLGERVHLVENVPRSQVGAFYAGASLFVLPSRHEPFGIVALEAGAMRKPVVATRVGGIPEFLKDGANGLLVPPDDVAALATSMERLLGDSSLAAALGERLYEDVVERFTWRRAWQEYLAIAARR